MLSGARGGSDVVREAPGTDVMLRWGKGEGGGEVMVGGGMAGCLLCS